MYQPINKNLKKKKIEAFIIWGHGLIYFNEILNEIRSKENYKILYINHHKLTKIKKFVYKIYSIDYAPLIHIKSKINYLLHTKPEVIFIFFENFDPQDDYFGEDIFRIKQSTTTKILKDKLRKKFNPKNFDGSVSNDHIVHSSDNHEQVDMYLKILGYSDGIDIFTNNKKILSLPFYIHESDKFEIKQIKYLNLYCNQLIKHKDMIRAKTLPVKESAQYRALIGNEKEYIHYINNFKGKGLNQDYNFKTYCEIKKNFEYLSNEFRNNFVIVKKIENDNYLILDGLHRASLHMYQGNQAIKCCIVEI